MSVYVLATLDTKGLEAEFVRDRLGALGIDVKLADVGSLGPPRIDPDITREAIFNSAGSSTDAVRSLHDRGQAVELAQTGAARLVLEHYRSGRVAGILGLGGSAGTLIGTAAMRALPLGVPKVMVSTLASGQTRQYVGDKDILMLNAVVDIAGLNRICRTVLDEAVRAMAGLVSLPRAESSQSRQGPIIALTMFGVTTPCVDYARAVLERERYETLVFHATGAGGRALESLIGDGEIAAVLDFTTTELADELVGGFLSAGPARLTAAGEAGIPQVVSVGAVDMVNFFAPETVPIKFRGRTFHRHDPQVTLMRTSSEECARIGADIGRKVAAAAGPVAVFLPRRGVSRLDAAGQPFDDPNARVALFSSLRKHAGSVEVVELDHHINDSAFAEAAAYKLLDLIHDSKRPLPHDS